MKNTKQWVRAVCLILAALMLLSTLEGCSGAFGKE